MRIPWGFVAFINFIIILISFSIGFIEGGSLERTSLMARTYDKEFVIVGKYGFSDKITKYKVKDKDGKEYDLDSEDDLELGNILTMRKK